MSPKTNNISAFFKALPKNIFSGFVVSLIALPLGLGLAMASDAPPIAGIIAAVIGGVMVSILGGSHVTIVGPGNGLVGVLLVAITTLGLESAYIAIVCSGILLLLLGFFRMGALADFFPSAAIQGMLAAIGLIILGKQFHIMMAHKIKRADTIDYLVEIPFTINDAVHYENKGLIFAALAGILSLTIMLFYSKIRNKYLQLIPAPMWIVILSIAFSYYFEFGLHEPNPIAPQYMVSGIPSIQEIIADIPTPNFIGIWSFSFWGSVLALTLISSIESLLSIKAVDKLDPEKRRSNVNRDLKALGLATVGSGLLGGLNVVTVIARSSVNVNQGGTNRSSNFFHALFLVLFIAFFSTQLTRIPLPALMAILVYTGYKLASPKVITKMFSIGKEQLIIFFVTLIVTLKIGLITGILAGVIATFIIHVVINKHLGYGLIVRNLAKPNVLMYMEQGKKNNYYVSVKHFCSFLNYFRLKKHLDAIPENKDVIVDFSLCHFVDDTVLENISNYQELFDKRGGHFDVVGLDMHDTETKHPFASRRLLPVPNIIKNSLTRRQTSMETLAENYSLTYHPKRKKKVSFLNNFSFFNTKHINHIYNKLNDNNCSISIFDIEFSEGEFIAKEVGRKTMLHIDLDDTIPKFTLDKEGFLEKVSAFAGFKDIDIDNHDDFSNRFYLLGDNRVEIAKFFNDDVTHFFESNPYYHVESNGNALLIFGKERLASIKEIKALYDFGKRLRQVISKAQTIDV
ncbi:SulP family inorganic anion transporter [Algibacter amylolyticus]|uniref:SulP family inorganic anion transporter n=1 Tax=Algibacter amylolyticus TaxID=1608400 RepID=A0A5M7BJ30_9FLAO|nr:SulP family inorganic anion transporter [Algibacter amylolyticus]KAA5827471.1 SulP family inorganic anion transporter [Algibacter amylolyticus]MBB5266668.1 MFS superfamily sulfate permease-like transporter [Algibacter amylolyticus]TSJ81716.1 SulP family inorganic anion transporter [Algibacter amylolyticus]